MTDWIVVRHWEKFQHYRDRRPTWIKLYTSLLHDPQYLELSMGARGLLHTIWMTYAVENGTIRVQDVAHFAHKRVSKVQLISLNHAGFVTFSASKPLARYIEKEEEKEEELAEAVENPKTPPPTVRRRTDEPSLIVQAFELVKQWPGGPSEEFDAMLDALEQRCGRRLRHSDRERLFDHYRQHMQ